MAQVYGDIVNGKPFDACHTTKKNYIGRKMEMGDGRVFRYCKAGEAITIGDLIAASSDPLVISATFFGASKSDAPVAGSGGAIGDTRIEVFDLASGSATANEYQDGFLVITAGTGAGQMFKVRANTVLSSTEAAGRYVYIYDGLITALDNTSVGLLIKSPYDGVIVADANTKEVPLGIACTACDSESFFWICTCGPAPLQAGTQTIDVGEPVIVADDDAGSGCVLACSGNSQDLFVAIGSGLGDVADGSFGPVMLTLGP